MKSLRGGLIHRKPTDRISDRLSGDGKPEANFDGVEPDDSEAIAIALCKE
jgi:hypothetical protein